MANYENLKAAIDALIKANGQREITGPVMNQVLKAIIDSVGSGYNFVGVASLDIDPGTPDSNVFYLAYQSGTYTYFDGINITDGLSVLMWDGQWSLSPLLTTEQYAAIGSGITAALVDKLSALPTDAQLTAMFNNKVNKVPGMGLSTNDYTNADKAKLTELPTNSELTTALGNKVDEEQGKGLSTNDYTNADKAKLTGLPTSQQLAEELGNKVDKVTGKGLSANDYTDADKTKLAELPNNAELIAELNKKVDEEQGKGLSTNDYTNADKNKLEDLPTSQQLTTLLGNKVDKESGKGLSANDYTNADKNKLADLPTSQQLATALGDKVDKQQGKGLSTNDYTNADKNKLGALPTNSELTTALGDKEDSSNKVTELTPQGTDTQYPSAKAVYDFVKEEMGKARETVVVTATANTGDVSEDAVITVKVDNTVVGTGTGTLTLAVVYGKQYVVECSRVYDYLTPAVQTFTAGQSVRNVSCAYTYIARDVITIDQTETDETAMVTGDVQGTVIQAIRSHSHLYLGKQTEDGNQLICQLSDSDGTKYADGTDAALDGTEGDQWMKLPVFWWKVIPGADAPGTVAEDGSYDSYSFAFAFAGEPDPTWKKWEGDKNLLGAKKMYVTGGKGYSRSGIQGSANFTMAQGNNYAAARGTGYSCVTWEWQWMMCVLFYAWYGRMNSQAQCGSGSNSNTRTLGTKDSLGMTDTTSSNGNADNTKFWGIENWWGDLSEWIGNITSNNYVVTITDMNTGENRNVSGWYQFGGTGGYASRFKVTENLDFIPRAKDATETTSYCDWVNGNSGSRVVFRSFNSASASGGVADVNSVGAPSYASAGVGSRLAFNGEITEAESVAAFKAA